MLPLPTVSRELLRDAAIYLAATLVLGAAANVAPGRHLAWWGKGFEPPQVGSDFVFIDAGSADALRASLPRVVFLDTRAAADVAAGRVPGALAIAYTDLARQLRRPLLERLRAADAIIIYGGSDEADVEQLLAQELRRRGLAPPHVLAGGFAAWLAGGLPVESAR